MTEDRAFEICDVVPGHMHEHQMRWLYKMAQVSGSAPCILEIGSADGRSACMMAHAIKGRAGTIHTIDNRLGKYKACAANAERFGIEDTLFPNLGVSPWDIPRPGKTRFDMAFIDADHNYPSVACDIGVCVSLLRRGGFLCGHDYANTNFDVKAAVDQLVFNKDYVADFGVECGCWWARLK